MSDIVETAVSPNNCSHFVLTGVDDGEVWSETVHDNELLEPLTAEEKKQLRRLLLRKLKQKTGLSIPQLIRRVLRGEEATNMKVYPFLGKGVSVTKTNIGTAYVNISPRVNGERTLVEFVGCTEYRIRGWANLTGGGPYNIRVIKDGDNDLFYESPNLNATGERELDTDWQPLPAMAVGTLQLRLQAKSATATDDPVFGGVEMAVR